MSATAGQADGVRSLADRFGFEPTMVVMEMGYDDDVDEDLRDALTERVGDLVDEDTDEVVDAVLLWYRDGDGDLFELLTDALGPLADSGVVWLLTPRPAATGTSSRARSARARRRQASSRPPRSTPARTGRQPAWSPPRGGEEEVAENRHRAPRAADAARSRRRAAA
ncbi:hypothetical protein Asp14428_27610 [Actinoplanes sp. NBRC 14428]|nr:hypothetical protein Asp14428_27610 [Actinoplanes sp. NBRC 14428]